ncbi:MAG: CcmD family protein [Candidatus Kapabacteria bacterium]|jgi:hypothetical protein|nr:CcmD family protein [Candidatus Kapabacteria bacterium]
MEAFLHDNALYVVLGIAIILWVGISIYLFMIDKKIGKIEQVIEDRIDLATNENSNI